MLSAKAALVNLAAGDGHPAEIMDMSFAIQALSALYLVQHKESSMKKLSLSKNEVDNEVACRKLKVLESWKSIIELMLRKNI